MSDDADETTEDADEEQRDDEEDRPDDGSEVGSTTDDPTSGRRDREEPNVPNPDEFLADGVISRRTLIRIVIAIAIGIPFVVEGLTFLGLIQDTLFGDGDDGEETTTTTTERGVTVGDELLPDDPNPATVRELQVRALEDTWRFSMTVEVVNGGQGEYQFRLATVTTDTGTSVTGGAATDRLAPQESAQLTATWDLPVGERPETVQVIAITIPEEGSPETRSERVQLANVPVQR